MCALFISTVQRNSYIKFKKNLIFISKNVKKHLHDTKVKGLLPHLLQSMHPTTVNITRSIPREIVK